MPFIDLGQKEKIYEPTAAVSPEKSTKPEKFRIRYPHFSINRDEPLKLKIGEEMEVKVKIKVTGLSKDPFGPGDSTTWRHEFEVISMDMGDKPSKKSDQEELEDAVEDDLKEMARK